MQNPLISSFAFTCADPRATAESILLSAVLGSGAATETLVDGKPWSGPPDFARILASTSRSAHLNWTPAGGWLLYEPGGLVRIGWRPGAVDAGSIRPLLEAIAFRWMSAATLSSVWGPGTQPREYFATGFAEGHYDHGWICAFKGDGHRQLVSRRWLDYGPWRLIRAANDVSMVQFHDLAADDLEALAQAEPGHRRMGISPEGGFIEPEPFPFKYPEMLRLYDPKARVLTVVAHGRLVEQREMLEACARRLYTKDPAAPIDNIAFVFLDENGARAHLRELWLRELECRVVIAGREQRLDTSYTPPPPEVPDWVKRVRDREGF